MTNGDLEYVRADDANGTAWGTPLSVDTAGNVGTYTSLAVVNGNPAISYYDGQNADLKYVRSENPATPTNTPTSTVTPTPTAQGSYLPAILRSELNSDPTGPWWPTVFQNLRRTSYNAAEQTLTRDALVVAGVFRSHGRTN